MKIGLVVFLCLSLFMLAGSVTRAASMYYPCTPDVPWQVFWLYVEACVGVLMASITVYRSLLIGTTNASGSFRRFIDRTIQKRTSGGAPEQPQPHTMPARFGRFLLSTIPHATLTGLPILFGHPGQESQTEKEISAITSNQEVEDNDYHDHLRQTRLGETLIVLEGTQPRQ